MRPHQREWILISEPKGVCDYWLTHSWCLGVKDNGRQRLFWRVAEKMKRPNKRYEKETWLLYLENFDINICGYECCWGVKKIGLERMWVCKCWVLKICDVVGERNRRESPKFGCVNCVGFRRRVVVGVNIRPCRLHGWKIWSCLFQGVFLN